MNFKSLNLKNIDYKHVLLIVLTLLLSVYTTLVADGVPLPAKLATVAAMITSIVNWLNQSPVASSDQIAAKTTKADIRAKLRFRKENGL
jgi:hypothetical protein